MPGVLPLLPRFGNRGKSVGSYTGWPQRRMSSGRYGTTD